MTNAAVAARLDRLEASAADPMWITLRPRARIEAEVAEVAARAGAGHHLPLAGRLLAVKDNIDVAGIQTTAACPDFSYLPTRSATAVARLVAAGAVVVGKTNLDQFATGLVGTRSPYGIPRSVLDPVRVSGGSSSGSAVAVATGLVDLALGTDTAGSGRVPAAFNGIIGLKPTLGLVPKDGVVPAAESFDTVTVFARTLREAAAALRPMIGPEGADPSSRRPGADVRCAAPARPTVAVPCPRQLESLSHEYRAAFDAARQTAQRCGFTVTECDIEPLLAAARLLYDGALVAERYTAVGHFVAGQPASVDPIVARIILDAQREPAWEYVRDRTALVNAKAYLAQIFSAVDALLLPVTTEHPLVADVLADPVAINRRLGTFTNFANLLDTAACAVPAPPSGPGGFGVMFVGPAFHDQVVVDLASMFLEQPADFLFGDYSLELAVFGAHLRGQPLHHQLEDLGARYVGEFRTASGYRMVALNTDPPKPAVARGTGDASICGERYRISPAGLGRLVAQLPEPMALTPIESDSGTLVTGFTATPHAFADGWDITAVGDWRRFLADE